MATNLSSQTPVRQRETASPPGNVDSTLDPTGIHIGEHTAPPGRTSSPFNPDQNLVDETRPLIDNIANLSVLSAEYENGSQTFLKQIAWLQKKYRSIRKTRGDGDCFYRSVAFAYVENLMRAPLEERELAVAKFLSEKKSTFDKLEAAQFSSMIFEDFYEVFASLLERVVRPVGRGGLTPEGLLATFQVAEDSNSIVYWLRLLTSAEMRGNSDHYQYYVTDQDTGKPIKVQEFCERFVEPFGKEADAVQVSALASALKISIDIAYLDGRDSTGAVRIVQITGNQEQDDAESTPLTLLYRPGHYDILSRDAY